MLELVRRLILLACLLAGLWLYFLADLSPLYSLRLPKQVEPVRKHGPESLLDKPRPQAPPSLVELSGPDWKSFLDKAAAVSGGRDNDPDWLRRVPDFERTWGRPRDVYFRASEAPVSGLGARELQGRTTRVKPSGEDGPVLEVSQVRLTDDSFSLGSGLSGFGPPMEMVFTHRHLAYVAWSSGLLVFLGLGWLPRPKEVLEYDRWRIALGDLGWVVLTGIFFGLPLAIVGGSVQALAVYGVLPAFSWPLAGLGVLTMTLVARSAAFRVTIAADTLVLAGLGRPRTIAFAGIAKATPVAYRLPRWLIWLLWLSSLLGKGAGRMVAAGQAMMFSGTQSQGIALKLKGGGTAYIWLTDPMGSMAVPGGEKLAAALDAAKVSGGKTVRVVTGLFQPEFEKSGEPRVWAAWLVGLAIFLGPALMTLIFRR